MPASVGDLTHMLAMNMVAPFKTWQERMREPSLTALLIVEILLIFVAIPLRTKNLFPSSILTVMIVLFLIASLLVALQSRLAMAAFLSSAILSLITRFIHHPDFLALIAWFDAGAQHTAICAVSWVIAKVVFKPGRMSIHRVEAVIILYINLALLFLMIYSFVFTLAPEEFSGPALKLDDSHSGYNLLYFSLATIAHTGYDGIAPVGVLARTLVSIESLIGLLYPTAVLLWFVFLQMKQYKLKR
jgi:hypothetical protein